MELDKPYTRESNMGVMVNNDMKDELERFRATMMTREMKSLRNRMTLVGKESRIIPDRGSAYRGYILNKRMSNTPSKNCCYTSCGFCQLKTLPVLQIFCLLICTIMAIYIGVWQFLVARMNETSLFKPQRKLYTIDYTTGNPDVKYKMPEVFVALHLHSAQHKN